MKAIFYTCLLMLTMTTASWSQVYVASSGTIKVTSTGTLYTSGALENNGILDTDGNVYYLSDLVNNGNMLAAGGRSYFISSTLANQNISGSSSTVLFNNLTLNLTSPGAEGVFVDNNMGVFVNQEINLQSGDFRLAGEAQLIQSHSGNSMVLGNGSILIDQQGTGDVFDFNYWSLPVRTSGGGYNLAANLYDGTNSSANPFQKLAINFVPTLNGSPGTPVSLSRRWLFKFINRAGNDPNGFQQVTPSDNFNPGEGFTMKGSGASTTQNYVLSGLPNDGNYNHSVSANNFSIIGNPYPSALDADVFINANLASFEPGTGLHFWDHFGGGSHVQREYQGGYAVYTLAGGTPALAHPSVDQSISSGTRTPGRFIPVGQAFFVQAAASGGTFTFTNAQRAFFRESDIGPLPEDSSVFFKANKLPDGKKTINLQVSVKESANASRGKIRLGHRDEQKFYRQLLLDFNPANTTGNDLGFDARMLDVYINDMYWLSDGEKLVIQSLPFNPTEMIPLGLVSAKDSFHEIQLAELSGIDEPVFLFDALNNTYYELKESPTKVWVEKGAYQNRFFITFRQQNTLSIEENTLENNRLIAFYSPDTGTIQLENARQNIENVEVYNLNGQRITVVKNLNVTSASIEFQSFSNGIYLLKIRYENGVAETRKVVKY